jgi:Mg/Co/Ni transporter MgtE
MAVTALIDRLGWDAAMGGGPFATVISDATSIIIYFVIATLLV